MKKPKFNFGDRVNRKDGMGSFEIHSIEKWEEGYRYPVLGLKTAHKEEELELSPAVPKKLYAFKKRLDSNWIGFRMNDSEEADPDAVRISEFDIEYPASVAESCGDEHGTI